MTIECVFWQIHLNYKVTFTLDKIVKAICNRLSAYYSMHDFTFIVQHIQIIQVRIVFDRQNSYI